jgi:hypothetical protein
VNWTSWPDQLVIDKRWFAGSFSLLTFRLRREKNPQYDHDDLYEDLRSDGVSTLNPVHLLGILSEEQAESASEMVTNALPRSDI